MGSVMVDQIEPLTSGNATQIKRKLDTSVVIASVDSSCYIFRHYKTDIVSSSCTETVADHTVLIVGYGTYTYAA